MFRAGSPVVRTPPATTLDGIVSAAARAHGDAPAVLRFAGPALSFTELDAEIDRYSAAIARLLAGTSGRAVVGLVSVLEPEFAVAYHAVLRSGHVVLVLNPYLQSADLHDVLARTGASLVVTDAAGAGRLGPGAPADLRRRVWKSAGPDTGVPTLADEAARDAPAPSPAPRPAVDDLACLHLTSGTTGQPKVVRLSHANLLANAAQIARAHRLGPDSVSVNHLPTYHPMHLNSALWAGARQVLCLDPDPIAALDAADATAATHLYGLPVRLARLATDPRLPSRGTPQALRAVLSGGSALAPEVADALAAALRVPVVQGYGLAETSPLLTSSPLDGHRPGSVGTVVVDTECRIVDIKARHVLGCGETGEIEVRGPQVMAGYLGHGPTESGIDAEGWLRTGDVGRLDGDGHLYVVDRIKDVFKCDNWLVAPAAVERPLRSHPAVRDCVVFDHPHPERGAVAHALVVRVQGATCSPATIATQVNSQLPEHEQLHFLDLVENVPRSGSGKIRRRDLRRAVLKQDGPDPSSVTHITIQEGLSWSQSSTG